MPAMNETLHDAKYWVIFTSLMHLITFVFVCAHALQRRRNASSTILWMFVSWSFPGIGPLLYLSFGIDRVSDKGLRKKATDQLMMMQGEELRQGEAFVAWHYSFLVDVASIEERFSRTLNLAIDGMRPEQPLLGGNAIEPLIGGDQAYPAMLAAIRAAENHIHLQSYIFNNDAVGREFLEALKARAKAGVRVRLLYDRFGSTHAFLGGLFRKYRHVPNMEIIGWTQANPLKRQFQVNLRNHRKALIVDGKVAFFGGVNISNENITVGSRAAIRDYHFKVSGPLVHELQYSFLRDWFFMQEGSINELLCQCHFPELTQMGDGLARVIDSGPSTPGGLISEVFFNAIIMARQQVLLVTPYFVPTPDILQALRSAARRGVDIRIILPEENNHFYAGLASKALYEELLQTGVRIYERKPPFIHAKALVADDAIALVGTANMDVRSLELNYETTVLISDETVVNQLKRIIHEDIDLSTELNLNAWLRRPMLHKVGENLCSLLSPVL